jgi:hypothetical protein
VRLRLLIMAAAIVGFCVGVGAGPLWITRLDQGWVESVGTLAAAMVSAFAAVAAITIATQDRRNVAHQSAQDRTQTLVLSEIDQTRERYRDLQDLLMSFDEYAGTRCSGHVSQLALGRTPPSRSPQDGPLAGQCAQAARAGAQRHHRTGARLSRDVVSARPEVHRPGRL